MSHHIDSEEIQNTNSVFDDFYSEEEDQYHQSEERNLMHEKIQLQTENVKFSLQNNQENIQNSDHFQQQQAHIGIENLETCSKSKQNSSTLGQMMSGNFSSQVLAGDNCFQDQVYCNNQNGYQGDDNDMEQEGQTNYLEQFYGCQQVQQGEEQYEQGEEQIQEYCEYNVQGNEQDFTEFTNENQVFEDFQEGIQTEIEGQSSEIIQSNHDQSTTQQLEERCYEQLNEIMQNFNIGQEEDIFFGENEAQLQQRLELLNKINALTMVQGSKENNCMRAKIEQNDAQGNNIPEIQMSSASVLPDNIAQTISDAVANKLDENQDYLFDQRVNDLQDLFSTIECTDLDPRIEVSNYSIENIRIEPQMSIQETKNTNMKQKIEDHLEYLKEMNHNAQIEEEIQQQQVLLQQQQQQSMGIFNLREQLSQAQAQSKIKLEESSAQNTLIAKLEAKLSQNVSSDSQKERQLQLMKQEQSQQQISSSEDIEIVFDDEIDHNNNMEYMKMKSKKIKKVYPMRKPGKRELGECINSENTLFQFPRVKDRSLSQVIYIMDLFYLYEQKSKNIQERDFPYSFEEVSKLLQEDFTPEAIQAHFDQQLKYCRQELVDPSQNKNHKQYKQYRHFICEVIGVKKKTILDYQTVFKKSIHNGYFQQTERNFSIEKMGELRQFISPFENNKCEEWKRASVKDKIMELKNGKNEHINFVVLKDDDKKIGSAMNMENQSMGNLEEVQVENLGGMRVDQNKIQEDLKSRLDFLMGQMQQQQ